ncbi:unnamed protein product [Caretta caretta]
MRWVEGGAAYVVPIPPPAEFVMVTRLRKAGGGAAAGLRRGRKERARGPPLSQRLHLPPARALGFSES